MTVRDRVGLAHPPSTGSGSGVPKGDEQILALLQGLVACARVFHLYPPSHRGLGQRIEDLHTLLEQTVPLALVVKGNRLHVDGIQRRPRGRLFC